MNVEAAVARAAPIDGIPVDFAGEWRNQLGSIMKLEVADTTLKGSYLSAVSGTGEAIQGELTGHINGDLISWVVRWPSAAITAWVGQVVNDGGDNVIETLWQMTTNIPDTEEPTGMWRTVFASTDQFHR